MRRSKRYYLLILLPMWMMINTHVAAQAEKEFDPAVLREDFAVFRGALEQAHPGIYWYTSKAQMDTHFDKLSAELVHPMSELDFYRLLAPLVSRIGCGHTWIATTEPTQEMIWERGKVLPLKIKFLNGAAYCIENNADDTTAIRRGERIISINNLTVDSLFKLSAHYSPGDGIIGGGRLRILDNVFNQFYTLYIGQPDLYALTVMSHDSTLRQVIIPPLPLSTVAQRSSQRYPQPEPVSADNITLAFKDSATAILTIRQFADQNTGKVKKKFVEEIDKAFRKMNDAGIKNLVIDLRENDGGDENLAMALYSHLVNEPFIGYRQIDFRSTRFSWRKHTTTNWWQYQMFRAMLRHKRINDSTFLLLGKNATALQQPAPVHFTGRVFVLTNEGTFSAASDFVALVHANHVATIVGAETGGSYLGNCSNYGFNLTLPYTKIRMFIPIARYQTNVNIADVPHGRGTLPHVPVNYTIEDLLLKKDKAMEHVSTMMIQRK